MLKKMFNGQKGFRQEKKPTKEQLERQAKGQAFKEGYEALCAKHGLQLYAIIEKQPNGGLVPSLTVIAYEPPKLKSWADASEENLETQKKCRHLNVKDNCKTCGVRIADQDESGTGVTQEFIQIKLEKIKAYREKEAKHDDESAEPKQAA